MQKIRLIMSGKVARGSIGSLAMRVISVSLALVSSILLARTLGAADFGAYGFALAVIEIFLVFAMLGLPSLLVREIPKNLHAKDASYVYRYISTSLFVVLVFSSVLSLVGYAFSDVVLSSLEPEMLPPLKMAFLMLPLLSLCWVGGGAIRGLGPVVLSQVPLNIIRPGFFVIFLLAMFWLGQEINAKQAVFYMLIATVVTLVVTGFVLFRNMPRQKKQNNSPVKMYDILRSGFVFTLIAGFAVINNQADVVMLGLLASAEETGIYRVASRLAQLVSFPYMALIMPLGPVLAKMFAEGRLSDIQDRTKKVSRYAFFGGILAGLPIVFFSDFFLGVFGDEFIVADNALLILSLCQLVLAAFVAAQISLVMAKYEKVVAGCMAFTALLNILFNVFFIPYYGVEGAATATLFSTIVLGLLLTYKTRQFLGFDPTILHLLSFRKP